MYEKRLEEVAEPQFWGIRLGAEPGETIVLREIPGGESIPLGLGEDEWTTTYEWTPGEGGTLLLARAILVVVAGDDAADAYAGTFAEKIISRLARHTWTLTDATVTRWVEAMEAVHGRS